MIDLENILSNWCHGQMGALGLVSVLISHVCDGELLAGLLIHPGEGSVDDSGLVVSASVLEDTLLFDAGAIAGLHVGAPLLGLNIGDLPHDLGKVGAGHCHGEEGDEDDEEFHVGAVWCLLENLELFDALVQMGGDFYTTRNYEL